jgi:hypothetical protein
VAPRIFPSRPIMVLRRSFCFCRVRRCYAEALFVVLVFSICTCNLI